jgi:hypothetical protein
MALSFILQSLISFLKRKALKDIRKLHITISRMDEQNLDGKT